MRDRTAGNDGSASKQGAGRPACTEPSPHLSELTALVEQIAAPVGRFDPVTNGMGQGHFPHLAGEVGLFRCTVRKSAAEAMDGGRNAHFLGE